MPKADMNQEGPLNRKTNTVQTYISRGSRLNKISNMTGLEPAEIRVSELGSGRLDEDAGIQWHTVLEVTFKILYSILRHLSCFQTEDV